MAGKSALTVTVLFFLFTLSYARTPSDLPENDVINRDTSTDLPESNHKATTAILLPSDKATLAEFETETETKLPETETGTTKSTEETEIESAPLKFISFRPINRHFPRRPSLLFRHGVRCRHHHKIKPWAPRFNGHEIPYGNDMILSRGEDVVHLDMDLDPVSRGVVRQVPAKWAKFHYGGPEFSFMNDMDRREEMKRPHHHHHHHHDRHVEGEEEEEKEEGKHEQKGGLVKLFRKFLHHF